ncbi:hypothetical protein, partial [Streptomyces katrae]|uniref:hypothetical protein n=1 Tax=Streptomyces katrae TaxID=68223 RepID=UPI001B804FE0
MRPIALRHNDACEVALLEVVRPSVACRAVRTARPGTRSPLAALEPVAPGGDACSWRGWRALPG